MLEPLAERKQGDGRQAQPGDDTLRLRDRNSGRARPGQTRHDLLDEAPAHSGRHRRRAVGHSQLLVEMLDVRLDRRESEVQLLRDLGQALPRRDEVQDLLFALRQRRPVVLLAQTDLRHESRRHIRRDDVFSTRAREHRVDDLLSAGLLGKEARGARLECLVDDSAVRERRDEQDANREGLPVRVLLVSAFTDSGVVYKALETGAAGFLSKEARREQIVDAVLACSRGEHIVPPDVAAGLVSEIRLRKQDDRPALTKREQEILHLIAAGKSLPEIAEQLYLGLTTVKTHVQHLYEKLGVSDRAAAVATGMRRGLIE